MHDHKSQTPVVFNHKPQGVLNPLTRDLYNIDNTCNQVFLNLQLPSKFLHLYFAGHDCSATPPF